MIIYHANKIACHFCSNIFKMHWCVYVHLFFSPSRAASSCTHTILKRNSQIQTCPSHGSFLVHISLCCTSISRVKHSWCFQYIWKVFTSLLDCLKWYMTKFLVMNEKRNKLSVLITCHVIVVSVKIWEYRNCSRKFLWVSNTDCPQLLLLTLKKWFSIGSVSHYIRVQDFNLLLRLSFICYNWFLHKYLKHRFGCVFFLS